MNKILFVETVDRLAEILHHMSYDCKHDPDFPMRVDFKSMARAKSLIDKAEVLLNTENENGGKKDGEMAASR